MEGLREYSSQMRAAETPEHHQARLLLVRRNISQQRERLQSDIKTLKKEINTFYNQICEVCLKRCYPNQIVSCRPSDQALQNYLPDGLKKSEPLRVCHRCKTHITSRKTMCPSKAYWNDLDPGVIPDVILQLNQHEQRLLARVIPYVKIFHLPGRFGQQGFRGQAVLFAQDIFEVTEKLPNMLPRSTSDSQMMVVTTHLENLNISREYEISRARIYNALRCLIDNNELYSDVVIDYYAQINQNDLVRVQHIEPEPNEDQDVSSYKEIRDASRCYYHIN